MSEENEKVDDVMENTEKDMKEDLTREMQAEAEETEAETAAVEETCEEAAQETAEPAEETAEEAENADNAKTSKEKKFFKKKKDKKDEKIEELTDRLQRQMAEFDNFRKRTEKEKSSMFEMGASDMIKKLLPIVDNFERGFNSISEEERETPFAKGMDMVYKQTMKMLEDSDVKPIEALGMEFNPELHNAVMHVEDDSVGEGIIVEEFEKGYTYRETVIRHSMVKVAN